MTASIINFSISISIPPPPPAPHQKQDRRGGLLPLYPLCGGALRVVQEAGEGGAPGPAPHRDGLPVPGPIDEMEGWTSSILKKEAADTH